MQTIAPGHFALFLGCLLTAGAVSARAETGAPSGRAAPSSLSISADSASEDHDSRALRIEGNVRISGPDWEFAADRATLEGALDDAEHFSAQGSPARIVFHNTDEQAGVRDVEGFAREISYRRHEDVLRLKGEARLRRDADTLSSEDIEYRRENDLFKAGGAGGVRLTITPGQIGRAHV